MWNAGWKKYDTIPVDDSGSCSGQQHPVFSDGDSPVKLFHRYQDEKGRLYMIRCPSSLSEDERPRCLVNIPAGVVKSKLAIMAGERRGSKRQDEGGSWLDKATETNPKPDWDVDF